MQPRMISSSLKCWLFTVFRLFFATLPPSSFLPVSPALWDLLPDTGPAAAAGGAAQLTSRFSHFSTDASLEHCKRLLHKSWVTYRQILSTPKLPERTAKPQRTRGWEREMEYFWALRKAECQHLIPSSPIFPLTSFSLFHSPVCNPPITAHSNSE